MDSNIQNLPYDVKKLLTDYEIILKESKKSRGLDEGKLLEHLEKIQREFKQHTGKDIKLFIKSDKS